MIYRYQMGEMIFELDLERCQPGQGCEGETYRAVVDGQSYPVEVLDVQPGQISLLVGRRPVTVYVAEEGTSKWASLGGCTYKLERPIPASARRGGEGAAKDVRAPMPAQVRSVLVSEGEAVTQGQTLLLLEAMKMEIRVKAPHAGQVIRLPVHEGDSVDRDQLLAEIR